MREAVGTAVEYANITWPANANVTLPMTLDFLITNIGGVPANLLVLYISFFSPLVSGEYKYFLANLAFCDLSYCLSAMFAWIYHMVHYLYDIPMNATRCSVQTIFSYTIGFCMAMAIPLASISQYIVIVRGRAAWMTKRRVILLCSTAYLPVLWPIWEFFFAPDIVYYSRCNYSLYTPLLPDLIIDFLMVYVGITMIFCNVSIYRVLSSHMNSEHIRNERSILKAVVIQGSVPLICLIPVCIVFGSVAFYGWASVEKIVVYFSRNVFLTWMDIGFYFFELIPLIDALITMTIVKQYRSAMKLIVANFKYKFCCGKRRVMSMVIEETGNSMQGQGVSGHTYQGHVVTEL